jgi:hypothetical protein
VSPYKSHEFPILESLSRNPSQSVAPDVCMP